MANFTSAILALVGERDRVFLTQVSERYNLPFEELSKLYLETAEQAIKVPRKYTKKVKAVTAVTTVTDGAEPKSAKAPKAKAEKQKCTACTSKKEPCKFSALKGEVFCKRHLRTSQEEAGVAPKEKATKKVAKKPDHPVHTHDLTQKPTKPCELCESHGNPLDGEADFEVVIADAGTKTVAERLAEILAASDGESDAESDAGFEADITEEAFDEE